MQAPPQHTRASRFLAGARNLVRLAELGAKGAGKAVRQWHGVQLGVGEAGHVGNVVTRDEGALQLLSPFLAWAPEHPIIMEAISSRIYRDVSSRQALIPSLSCTL